LHIQFADNPILKPPRAAFCFYGEGDMRRIVLVLFVLFNFACLAFVARAVIFTAFWDISNSPIIPAVAVGAVVASFAGGQAFFIGRILGKPVT
jgi:hypothetical protein